MAAGDDYSSGVTRSMVQRAIDESLKGFTIRLITGQIQVPPTPSASLNLAGGVNHYPDSDISYSTNAVTVQGTTPASAGDGNHTVWRHWRQKQTDNVVENATHALKAVGHSLYAADEGVNTWVPDWDRVKGWIEIGSSAGKDQYNIAVEPLTKLFKAGDKWRFLFRCAALNAAPVPAAVELYVGVWEQQAASEGWVTGGPFDLTYEIRGAAGTNDTKYRVLALTDSGVSILSNILDVPNAPDVLSRNDYPKLFHNAGPGFIEYRIYRLRDGVFDHLYTIRNSQDLQYNDTGVSHFGVVGGWPADPGNAPQAYAQTRTLQIGSFNNAWQTNQLTLQIPNTYDWSKTVKQFLRFGLTAETAVDRHLGIDRLWVGTTSNEWSPDTLPAFADGSYPVESVSPTSGNQGSGGGIGPPPDPGTGGGTCIVTTMGRRLTPVMVKRRRRMMVPFLKTDTSDLVEGELKHPYEIVRLKTGVASEWYLLKTRNGIAYPCNARHRLVLDPEQRTYIEAQQVTVGTRLAGKTTRGRKFTTPVTSIELIPEPCELGTYVLNDPQGVIAAGRGMFIAGFSPKNDRGLLSSNEKQLVQ